MTRQTLVEREPGVDNVLSDRKWERVLGYHREWARHRGLLDRPWFMLGSAPSPTIPAILPANSAYVYIKYAGHSARKRRLPKADLTLLLTKTEPRQIAGLTMTNVLLMGASFPIGASIKRLLNRNRSQQGELYRRERDEFIIRTLGSLFAGIGTEKRPSNGISLLCYALALDVPQIIIAGVSLESDGHDYTESVKRRRHVEEDRAALQKVAKLYPGVSTSEESLHRLTGLPLHQG